MPAAEFLRSLRERRLLLIVGMQLAVIIFAFGLAYALRFDLAIPTPFLLRALELLVPLVAIKLAVFWKMGLLRGWWRYASMADLLTLFKANVLASLLVLLYAALVYRLETIPRSVFILDASFCFLLSGGLRFAARALRENYSPLPLRRKGGAGKKVLIVGAGDAGQMIARESRTNTRLNLEIVGFVDDDPRKHGQRFQGFPVLGGSEELAALCIREEVQEVIIAMPSASGKEIRAVVERCREAQVQFKTLPGVGDLIDGRVSVQQIREVALEDLLGREAVSLDTEGIRGYLGGKRVLVTGAGGSIGSELCRQVARFRPARLILLESAETPLFEIERKLAQRFPDVPLVTIVGDIRHEARVAAVFDEHMPEVVFHAAAYKHVPMMEHNPAEAISNNIQGTRIVAEAAHAFKARHFVMISTDKAVNPTNVMGASKRAAEICVQALARRSNTHFVTVRFGNVLGSNGSVVPVFKEQIGRGGPVTVTHPEVTRYFMSIPEAAQLVLQAGSMGKGGEIFLLDMGEPVKIVKLAEELIRLSGMRPYEDIEIVFSGLRPGEKLYEELLLAGEGIQPTTHAKIRVARSTRVDEAELNLRLESLFAAGTRFDTEGIIRNLGAIVPEFQPSRAGLQADDR